MEEMRVLLENYWITRKNKELYTKVKGNINNCNSFIKETLGWQIIENEKVIKLAKVPAFARSYMGVKDFIDTKDYVIFCSLLYFLEDRDDGEVFILSELIDNIEIILKHFAEVDWTKLGHRQSLQRALKFAMKLEILSQIDGSIDTLTQSVEYEVLFENSGLSKFVVLNFNFDISNFTSYRDFDDYKLIELDKDRGFVRKNRVYRELVTAPAVYFLTSDNQDGIYIKNQRNAIQKNIEENLGARFHLHKNSAFVVLEEHDTFCDYHPKDNTLSDIICLFTGILREKVENNEILINTNDCFEIELNKFIEIIEFTKRENDFAWNKGYRELKFEKLCEELINEMIEWSLIEIKNHIVIGLPGIAKISGEYPADFIDKLKEEKQDIEVDISKVKSDMQKLAEKSTYNKSDINYKNSTNNNSKKKNNAKSSLDNSNTGQLTIEMDYDL